MSKRIVIFIGLVMFAVTSSDAGNPLSRLFERRRPATPTRKTNPIPSRILNSPEAMTKLFGANILIRPTGAESKDSRFVRQPE